MHESSSSRPSAGKPVLFDTVSTYEEYLCDHPGATALMQARQDEVRLAVDDQLFFSMLPQTTHMVVVAEPYGPGTIVVVPILARLASASPRVSFWIMDAESSMDWVGQCMNDQQVLLELPGRELPLLVLLDAEHRYFGHWGPHPAGFAPHMDNWRSRHPEWRQAEEIGSFSGECAALNEELLHEMRLWYNSGLNRECVAEIRGLLEQVQSEDLGVEPE